jgi:hypothetical protein
VYTTLRSPREVRLLKLSRKTLFTTLQCELIHTSLDKEQHYEAISYTWVGETPTLDMIVDGRILKVTPAVYDIASYRYTLLRSPFFWIDAVYINQEDIDERGQQVRLMRDIYKQAPRVVVWLGPLAKADRMLHFLAVQNCQPSVSPDEIYKSAMNSPRWDAVGEIFAHRWFGRVWDHSGSSGRYYCSCYVWKNKYSLGGCCGSGRLYE